MSLNLLLFLANTCQQASNLCKDPKKFKLPWGYRFKCAIKGKVLGNNELFGFIMESRNSTVIAFRSTNTIQDIISDAYFLQTPFPTVPNSGKTHKGFTKIYMSFRDQVMAIISNHLPRKKLYITGYSLGAALATLIAFDIAINTNIKKPLLINFGGPRVGNPTFVKYYNKTINKSLRVVNVYDIVPKVPPQRLLIPFSFNVVSYSHVLGLYEISVQTGSISENHSISTYIKELRKRSYYANKYPVLVKQSIYPTLCHQFFREPSSINFRYLKGETVQN